MAYAVLMNPISWIDDICFTESYLAVSKVLATDEAYLFVPNSISKLSPQNSISVSAIHPQLF